MIYRFTRLPRPSFAAIDHALTQLYAYRVLTGGIFVKMQGRWYSASTLMVLGDGSRIFRRADTDGGSFHETFNGIQKLEEHT